MSRDFVIVIEADNKRAHAAYLKGMEELDRIWPQIESAAKNRDAERMAEYESKRAEYEEGEKHDREEKERYWQALNEWNNSSSWCRGPEPRYPHGSFRLPPYTPYSIFQEYQNIRDELKHMADVSGAAISPYRMTEDQVREMVAWEDGSRIERIKADIERMKK